MILLVLALSGFLPAASTPPSMSAVTVGRVYTSPSLHIGVRGALLLSPSESGGAVTIQLTCNVL